MKFKDDRGKVNLPALNLIMNMEVNDIFLEVGLTLPQLHP